MFNKNVNPVDTEKFKAQFEKRNVSFAQAAKELGVSRTTVSGWGSRKLIPNYAVTMLDKFYNIKYEDIAPDKEELEEVEELELKIPHNNYSLMADPALLAKLEQIDQHILEMTAFLKEAWGIKG